MCRTIYDICNDKYMQRKYISYQKCLERPTSHSVPALSRHGEIRFINLFIDFESFGDDLIINSNLNVRDRTEFFKGFLSIFKVKKSHTRILSCKDIMVF